MRTRFWVLAGILLIVLVAAIWWWRRSGPMASDEDRLHLKPDVAMTSMNITDISEDRIKMTCRVVVKNPLPVTFTSRQMQYEIYIDSTQVVKSSYDKPISVNSSDSSSIDLPMEILVKPMKKVFRQFEASKTDSADYTFKAQFHVDVPVAGQRTFDMDMTKRLPEIRIPEVQPGKIDVDKLGLHHSELGMVLKIDNPNIFPIRISDGQYTITIDSTMKMQGTLEKVVNLPAKGTENVTMNLDIRTANVGKLGWKFLFEKKRTNFQLAFNCRVRTENAMMNNSTIAFNVRGTLDDLKKMK